MDAISALLLLLGAGTCTVAALLAAKWLRMDACLERASHGIGAWTAFRRGFEMAGWMMLATLGAVTIGFVPTSWLTSPVGAIWFGATLSGSLAIIAWARTASQVRAQQQINATSEVHATSVRKAA